MFGYWLDTVDRQRGDTETICHWLDTADCQIRCSRVRTDL